MTNTQDCEPFAAMEPATQAEVLAVFAQQARLLEFALQGESDAERQAASELQLAIEQAMDDEEPESGVARRGLASAIGHACDAGLQLSARLNEIAVDGIVGRMRLSVLTAVLVPARYA
jgi:hypothetical protein